MEQFEHIIQKEMTRKEFLTALGLGIASIMGLGMIVRLLFSKPQKPTARITDYGDSAYGTKS